MTGAAHRAGARATTGPGVTSLGDASRKAGKVHVDRMVDVQCWCDRKPVRVYQSQLQLGRTGTCGDTGCVPPPGAEMAQLHCADCDEWFTPVLRTQRRCAPCNAANHMG